MSQTIFYVGIATMLLLLAMEIGRLNERISAIQETTLTTEAMITSMYTQGRVGQVVK